MVVVAGRQNGVGKEFLLIMMEHVVSCCLLFFILYEQTFLRECRQAQSARACAAVQRRCEQRRGRNGGMVWQVVVKACVSRRVFF